MILGIGKLAISILFISCIGLASTIFPSTLSCKTSLIVEFLGTKTKEIIKKKEFSHSLHRIHTVDFRNENGLVAVAYVAGEMTFHQKNKNWTVTQLSEREWTIEKKSGKTDITKCNLQ